MEKAPSTASTFSSVAGILFGLFIVGLVFIVAAIFQNIANSEISNHILVSFSSLPPEWLSGFISGIFATLIGFILTLSWDMFKFYRDQYVRDNAILSSARHELKASCGNIRTNISLLDSENGILNKDKYIVMPLVPLSRDIWELVKFNLPRKLSKNPTLLEQVCDASYMLSNLNEGVQSRENFRINNQLTSTYNERIKIYNELLLGQMKQTLMELEKLQDVL